MTEENKMLRIAVNLEGNVKEQFLEIKRKLGLKSHTDVFRFLITNYHEIKVKKEHTE